MTTASLTQLFRFDALAIFMILLVGFIGTVVALFASRYMQGDSQYRRFFTQLGLLIITVMMMVSADHLLILLLTWAVSNFLLVRLMIHKPQWKAAFNAGLLATKTFSLGFISLSCALLILYNQTHETSIHAILNQTTIDGTYQLAAALLLFLAAITQSAIWPFHRWLLSSLNSPTPVSAIMHAGLVNGGGFLLARFASLFISMPSFLVFVFLIGAISALLGTFWKLMQCDIKRMLACSTMGQMGFMFMQCGLGLFPAAIAHLCWHGMFKANLFLSSNSASKEKRTTAFTHIQFKQVMIAAIIGIFGSFAFATAIESGLFIKDTRLFLIGMVFITASQFALSLLINLGNKSIPTVFLLTTLATYTYGLSVFMSEWLFRSMNIYQPQPINIVHIFTLTLLFITWIMMVSIRSLSSYIKSFRLAKAIYIKSINASQPHPSTVTSYRSHYQ